MELEGYISTLEKTFGMHVSGIKDEKKLIDKVKEMKRNHHKYENLNVSGKLRHLEAQTLLSRQSAYDGQKKLMPIWYYAEKVWWK